MKCMTTISSDRSQVGITCLRHEAIVNTSLRTLDVVSRDSNGNPSKSSFHLSNTRDMKKTAVDRIAAIILDETAGIPSGAEEEFDYDENTILNLYREIDNVIFVEYLLGRQEQISFDGEIHRLREINALQQSKENGPVDYSLCRRTEAECLSPAGAAYLALSRIWDRCEPIEAHLPESERTGYTMREDIETVFDVIMKQMSRRDFEKTCLMKEEPNG